MRGSRALSDRPVDVGAAPDPVAAFVDAHERGGWVALRTSGSTGPPRWVVRSTRSWVASFGHVAGRTALGPRSRVWVPGPLSSTMNLFAAVLARWSGAGLAEAPEGASHAHLTPGRLDRLLAAGVPLDGVRVTVAGDRLSLALHARAVAAGARVTHYYGAAELSFVAWGSHADDLRAFPGVEVQAREGELWVRSPYLCRPGGTGSSEGPLRWDGRGFATVGDRGRVVGGLVGVEGRGGLGVTTGGATVHVPDVERVLRASASGEVAVVGVAHAGLGQVVAAVLTDGRDAPRARSAARSGLSAWQRPRLWFEVPALPLTAAGKVDRDALAAQVGAAHRGAVPGIRRLLPGAAS